MDENPVLKKIKSKIAEAGSQTKVAIELGISVSYLSDILNGKREISENVARKLGFKRQTKYIPTIQVTVSPDHKIHGDQIGAGLAKIEWEKAG
jgi:transcriptional regulator with XRE-family HTH domain